MIKCLTADSFIKNLEDIITKNNDVEVILTNIKNLLNQYNEYENHEELIELTSIYLEEIDLAIEGSTLQNWIDGKDDPVNPDSLTKTDSIDSTLPSKKSFRRGFLNSIYGDADVVRAQVENKTLFDFSNLILFDRKNAKIVHPSHINDNIRDYQQQLFNEILDYIEQDEFFDSKLKKKLTDKVLYVNGEYTGTFEKSFPVLRRYFKDINDNVLLYNYLSNSQNSKKLINAFNAYQILLHFDEFMLNAFGDNITIKNIRTRFSSSPKYFLKNKSKEMAWSNQKDDDIIVADSINNLSKLLITTTRMYDSKAENKLIPNRYISTNEFIAIINKIHNLFWTDAKKIQIKDQFNNVTGKVSEETKKFIKKLPGNTFADLLTTQLAGRQIRNIKGWSALIDFILSNDTILKDFDLLERNILVSLKKELFDNSADDNNKSLASIKTSNNHVLHTLMQTIEGIWPVRNCSVEVNEHGTVLQEMANTEVRRIQFNLNTEINALNHFTVYNPNNFKIKQKEDKTWEIEVPVSGNKAFKIIGRFGKNGSFKLELGGVAVTVEDLTNHKTDLLKFIDSILHQNLVGDPAYFDNLKYVYKDIKSSEEGLNAKVLQALLRFSSAVLVNTHLSYKANLEYENLLKSTIDNKTVIERQEFFEKAFAQEYPDNNTKMLFQLQTFDLIPQQQIVTLEQIALAKAITRNVSISRQVNDAEGNAISTASPSRLSSNLERQWQAQKNDKKSPCNGFLLIQNPNVCRGLFSVRDYKNSENSKKYIQFSTREFLEDSFYNSFLKPLLDPSEDKYDLLKDDKIAIIPAVYSDKNTVTKMVIDLKPLLSSLGIVQGKAEILFKDEKYTAALKKFINEQLSGYYNKIIEKIKSDLKLLAKAPIFKTLAFNAESELEYTAESYHKLEQFIANTNEFNASNGINTRYTMSDVFDIASKETGVKLNEELHLVRTGNTITVNNTLINLHSRYNENFDGEKTTRFWEEKGVELFQYLLNSRASIDVHQNEQVRKFFNENGNLKKWKNSDGKIVLGVVSILDENSDDGFIDYPISNKIDFEEVKIKLIQRNQKHLQDLLNQQAETQEKWLESAIEEVKARQKRLENLEYNVHELINKSEGLFFTLNPVIEQFNLIHYLFSQQFMLSSVGSHINHPVKRGKINLDGQMSPFDFIKEESDRTNAQNKRNVAHTASVHPFQLNLKEGITDEYKIACIDDINDLMYNTLGDNAKLKPFDGATYVDPYTVHLENHSLQGEAAGIHKKQFVHFYDDETGTGGAIKTAGFGITNFWIRNSPFIQRLNKKLTNETWKNKNGESVYLDITKKIQNPELQVPNNNQSFTAYYMDFDAQGNKQYYRQESIVYLGEGKYELVWKQVDKKGNSIPNGKIKTEKTGPINSTYKVYEYIFKGAKCVNFNERGVLTNKGDAGESSILNTLQVINECGFIEKYNEPEVEFVDPVQDYSQDNFFQPAKHSLINYAPTAGAVKQGTANFNNKQRYYSDYTDFSENEEEVRKHTDFNYFKIKMNNAGIQLDKQHHADDSEISMMTQVVSACASLGHNWNESNKLYKALHSLTEQGIQSLLGPLMQTLTSGEQISLQSKQNLHKVLTTIIIKSLATGSKSKDGIIYSIAQELINKYLNGEILTDYDFQKCPIAISDSSVFNKIQSQISSILNKLGIKLKFKGILSVLIPSHEIMKIYGGKLKGAYGDFKKEILKLQEQQPILESPKQLLCGRTYRKINKETGKSELIHIQSPFLSEKEKTEVYGNPNLIYTSYYELNDDPESNKYQYQEYIIEGRNLAPYHCSFKVGDQDFNFYDLKVIKEAFTTPNKTDELRKRVQQELINLSKGLPVEVVGIEGKVTPTNLNVSPAEIIMPLTVASTFGLTVEDSLDQITENKEFFVDRLKSNLGSIDLSRDAYTMVLKNISGKHIYIIDRETYLKQQQKYSSEYQPEILIDPVNNEITRLDEDGNEMHKLASTSDQICTINGVEVIITDDLNFYVDNLSYNSLYISDKTKFSSIYNRNSSNKAFQTWKSQLKYEYAKITAVSENLQKEEDIENKASLNYNSLFDLNTSLHTNPNLGYLQTLGYEMYSSFMKYLEIIAARIPAQSMQSFMPMKIIGFDESGHNNAYVCTQQIWLQGSDFDIDCVSLLTYEFDKSGKFVGWSPFFDLSSKTQLEISTNLNYPTGKDVRLLTKDYFDNPSKDPTLLVQHVLDVFNAFTTIQDGEVAVVDPKLTNEIVNIINNLSENGVLDFSTLTDADKAFLAKTLSNNLGVKITNEIIDTVLKDTIKAINKHNFYIKSNPNVEAFTKNYVVEQMIRIAKNPANLSQAQISVDQPTKIAKDIADANAKSRNLADYVAHGNVGSLLKAIEDNHVGKDVIGISAVGLKAFFAITQYTNTVLNTDPNPERIFKDIIFNGKTYFIIANANAQRELNSYILDTLQQANETDAALLISALLSLATDNAKELCLAKLNANADMAGMYIYGLTLGIPFEELGVLLMSDLGNTVVDLLKGSIITGKLTLKNIDKVLEFINRPASIIKSTYLQDKYQLGKNTYNAWDQFMQVLFPPTKNHIGGRFYIPEEFNNLKSCWDTYKNSGDKISFGQYHFPRFIDWLIKQKNVEKESIAANALGELFILIKNYNLIPRDKGTTINGDPKNPEVHPRIVECRNALLDALLTELKIPMNDDLQNFQVLHEGAKEMKLLGALLGANQGIKNPIEDFLKFIQQIENIKIGKNEKLDFQRFMTNEEYRRDSISAFDELKVSFNILEILTTVPQYWGYLETIYMKHGSLLASSKRYRTLHKQLKNIKTEEKAKKKIQALNRLISYKMNNDYFLQKKAFFVAPANTNLVFIKQVGEAFSQTTVPTSEPLKIYLGTQGGNATFKHIVETVVIPNLKLGKNSNINGAEIVSIKENKFIKSLRPNIYDKNPGKNASISYSTDIDMSPRDELGEATLANLRQAFDFLTQDFIIKDESGAEIFRMPIKEIFFYYNLIAYNGAQGSSTITKLLDNYVSQYKQDYRQILNYQDLESGDFEINATELAAWTTQISGISGNNLEYIYMKDKASMTYKLMQVVEDSLIEVTQSGINQNLVLHTPTEIDNQGAISSLSLNIDGQTLEDWECYKDAAYNTYVLRGMNGETYPLLNVNLDQIITSMNEQLVFNTEFLVGFIQEQRNNC